ncbi:GRP family sugar transporter [Alistipes sp.]|uniref:GRP family sugar transporter n=1 Tax=Alistipes sp. TaxID=1872444 RepID=UPI003AEFEE7B
MEWTEWLVALVPMLSFGLIPVIGTLIGGKPVEQSMGIALGGLLFSLAVVLVARPEITPRIFVVGFISGACWAVGSIGQFAGIRRLGVARATPMLNGGQIIGTALVGMALGDWASQAAREYGLSALGLIIAGILCTSYTQRSNSQKPQWAKGIAINLVAAAGFTAYVGILKYYHIASRSAVLPQSLGQIAAIFLYGTFLMKTRTFSGKTLRNGTIGIIWGVGNLALLVSGARLGLAVAYPVSQAAALVSVVGGVIINRETKTRREWVVTALGFAAILGGLYLLYLSEIH